MKQMNIIYLAALLASVSACGSGGGTNSSVIPSGMTQHSITRYTATSKGDGATAATQDLLTAGLGKSGLAGAAPAFANPASPTALELRRNAVYSNYRALVDYTSNGGYGTLYGANLDNKGNNVKGEGLIPGVEYLASIDSGNSSRSTVAVLIPSSFDVNKPCIIAGPSSGSRGVYGSIASAGEWGLKQGCAVTLTDAGKGVGIYDPNTDTVNKIDGTRDTRSAVGLLSNFAAVLSDSARTAFNALFPNRLAIKHAHSQNNPEKDWGSDTLQSIRYALYALNQEYASKTGEEPEAKFTAANTIVIAASVSNGGAAVLRAAEQDKESLIDGVVAAEPSAQPNSSSGYAVQVGGATVTTIGKPLLDYFTFANIYQPCAVLASSATMSESSIYNYMTLTAMNARAANRCAGLAAKGLVAGSTTAEQAANALLKLREYGYTADNDTMHNAHYGLGNSPIIAMMYTNALGRFSLTENLCGMSAAAVNATGDVVAVNANALMQSFANANGTTNGSPASVVYNDSVGGAKSWAFAVSPSTNTADFALDAALCQRALVIGKDVVSGATLTASSTPTLAQSEAVIKGVKEVLLNGNLQSKPTIIVTGRSDALVPPNHSARAYTAFNRSVEGAASQVSYIEVFNAQHFDTFLPFSGFDTRFVPLHPYFNRALNSMYAKLTTGEALPPNQVVRTTVRGGTPGQAPAISAAAVPNFTASPATADMITWVNGSTISIPN